MERTQPKSKVSAKREFDRNQNRKQLTISEFFKFGNNSFFFFFVLAFGAGKRSTFLSNYYVFMCMSAFGLGGHNESAKILAYILAESVSLLDLIN